MKALSRSTIVAAAILLALGQQAGAQIMVGTTGACNNDVPGGPCTQTSTLVLLDSRTGALVRTIGPVGFTVNGLAFDWTTLKLYASTAIGDTKFHGLITINPFTGKGTPVNKAVQNFGLAGPDSPIHSIAVDVFGHMVGWYDETPPPDTYVRINQRTGVATEFPNTGINTSGNGVSFGEFNLLWNIDSPRFVSGATELTQTAYLLNPFDGTKLLSKLLSPPTQAAIGAFHPVSHIYYGLNFTPFTNLPVFIEKVDVLNGTITQLGQTVDNLHTLAFIP